MRFIPIVLTCLIYAAHFLRGSQMELTVLLVLLPILLFVKKRWSIMVLQVVAFAATINWFLTAYEIMQVRQAADMPYLRMLAILGVVALFSAWSGWLLQTKPVQKIYQQTKD